MELLQAAEASEEILSRHGDIIAVTVSVFLITTDTQIMIGRDYRTQELHKAVEVHNRSHRPAAETGKDSVSTVFGGMVKVAEAVMTEKNPQDGFLNGVGTDIAIGLSV